MCLTTGLLYKYKYRHCTDTMQTVVKEKISCHKLHIRYPSFSLSLSGDGLSPVLILDFHQLGNLSLYLRDNSLHSLELIRFCLCIISGLEYLHRDIITSTSSKPGDIEIHYLHVGTQSVIATWRFHGRYHGPHAFKALHVQSADKNCMEVEPDTGVTGQGCHCNNVDW